MQKRCNEISAEVDSSLSRAVMASNDRSPTGALVFGAASVMFSNLLTLSSANLVLIKPLWHVSENVHTLSNHIKAYNWELIQPGGQILMLCQTNLIDMHSA